MTRLSTDRRRELKARAHSLKPVVLIGASGLTPGVLAEIDRSLKGHELIKLRAAGSDRSARGTLLVEICARTGAEPVQQIGRIFVIFRRNPEPSPREAGPERRGLPRSGHRAPKVPDKRQDARRAPRRAVAPHLRPYRPMSKRKPQSKR